MHFRMDWRHLGFDWNRTRAFLVTAEEGSFSAAARALGLTQPTLGRQVAALEEELGVTLFERAGTRLALTEAGLALLEQARAMGEAAARVSRVAAGLDDSVAGEVRVTAGEAIASFLLPSVLAGLRRDHPRVRVVVVASNEVQDLHRREADIALRNARPQHPELVGRRLRDLAAGLYASRELLERTGPLREPAQLAGAPLITFEPAEPLLAAFGAMGLPATPEQVAATSASQLVQWSLCRASVGVGLMLTAVGDADPDVVRVLPDFAIPVPVWLVCHRELHTSRRLRVVFDRLAEALG